MACPATTYKDTDEGRAARDASFDSCDEDRAFSMRDALIKQLGGLGDECETTENAKPVKRARKPR
jgi:hypothetical protein